METRTLAFSPGIKAGPDDSLPEGTFTAYASVFGNVDSYGDIMVKGAFKDTLGQWFGKGADAKLPLLFNHAMSDPFANIGYVDEATEDDHGLLVKCHLDLENKTAEQVYRLLKGRRINQMSFAFDVLDWAAAKSDDGEHREIKSVKLHEVSVVPMGANSATEIIAVKSAIEHLQEIKAGRTISARNEKLLVDLRASLAQAADALGQVLGTPEDEEKSSDTANADTHDNAKNDAAADETESKAAAESDEQKSARLSVEAATLRVQMIALGMDDTGIKWTA